MSGHNKTQQSKHHKGSGNSKKRAPETGSNTTGPTASTDAPLSFAFVINELAIDQNNLHWDQWGNRIPPDTPSDYVAEFPSQVFLYRSGDIEQPEDWVWYPRELGDIGHICRYDQQTGVYTPLDKYKTFTVFRGWRFLPFMFMGSDATTTPVDASNVHTKLHALHFSPRQDSPGVSDVNIRGNQYVAGRGPAWLSTLVGTVYRNPYEAIVAQSGGLAGELAVVLGLMGLSQGGGNASTAFTTPLWRNKSWRSTSIVNHDGMDPGPDDQPRAVLVQICFDPNNPNGSNKERLERFEWEKIIVRG